MTRAYTMRFYRRGDRVVTLWRMGPARKAVVPMPTLAVIRGDAPRKVYRTVLAHPSQAADAPRVA